MAAVNAPYGTKTGPGYTNGTGVAYEETSSRAHRTHHCINFILRVLTALATGAAIITLLKSNQTVRVGPTSLRARWNDFGAFKWFLLANAIVCAYAILAALASLLGICMPRGPLSTRPVQWLTFLVDFLLANALMSAAAAATTLAWIGYHGEKAANWGSQCGVVHSFCRRIAGALIASFVGWVFLALSTLVTVSAIHRLRRRVATY